MRTALTDYRDHARVDTDRWKALHAAAGYNEDDQVDEEFEYRPGGEIDDRDNLFTMRFLYAFWRLCEQGIVQLDDVPAGHAARLSAERAGVAPTSGSPSFARALAAPRPNPVVSVRQWYPSEQRHKVIYRGPYMKGPADTPLIGGDVVRSMTHR